MKNIAFSPFSFSNSVPFGLNVLKLKLIRKRHNCTWFIAVQCISGYRLIGSVSVVDPDPHGSGTFAWIQIRIRNSENSKLDPDPE